MLRQQLDVYPVFFDYGQHCVEKEWATLLKVLPTGNVSKPERLNLSDIFKGSQSRLIKEPDLWNENVTSEDLYIPYRTLLFFTLGAAFAQTRGIDLVYSAFINSNYVKEIDCSADFLNKLDAFSETVGPVRFVLPYRNLNKADVAKLAVTLSVRVGQTFSCQVFSDVACGACPNCVERIAACSHLVTR